MYPNRFICTVFEEMRDCFKTLNFSPIPGLIEEAQIMSNRMESALEDKKDIEHMHEKRVELKKEIDLLREERNKMKPPTCQGDQ